MGEMNNPAYTASELSSAFSGSAGSSDPRRLEQSRSVRLAERDQGDGYRATMERGVSVVMELRRPRRREHASPARLATFQRARGLRADG